MKATVAQLNTDSKFLAELQERGSSACELCGADSDLKVLHVVPAQISADKCVLACATCTAQLTGETELDLNHWRCLQDAIWSETDAVQVAAYRLLQQIKTEPWAAALLDQMYLDDDLLAWAEALNEESDSADEIVHKDSNGTILADGDSVSIIKDLEVKGAGFTAKRGTIVKNISLTSNPEHIEGRVNGTKIVLKTCFLKKVN
ncbi:PhnA domain-containing protein [Verrucomicrobiota bacterium]